MREEDEILTQEETEELIGELEMRYRELKNPRQTGKLDKTEAE